MADAALDPHADPIVMVCGSMPPDRCGVGAYTARIASELATRHALWCVQPAGTGHIEGADVVEVEAWNLRSVVSVLGLGRRLRPRLVIVQYPTVRYRRSIAIHLVVPALRVLGTRVLVVLHEHAASPAIGRLRNLAMVAFAAEVFVSNGLDRRALPGWVRRKTSLVPIGSNIVVEPSSDVPSDESSGRRATVGFFGHPFRSKRIEVFIDMVNDMVNDADGACDFEVISMFDHDDEYQEGIFRRLRTMSQDRPDRLRVIDDASDQEVSRLLRDVDYLVLPDDHPLTGKSGSSLAGIAHGVTVIGRAATDPADNLPYIHGVNCVLLPVMHSAAIVAEIERLEADAAAHEQILVGARTLAADTSWVVIADRYDTCIAAGSPADAVP